MINQNFTVMKIRFKILWVQLILAFAFQSGYSQNIVTADDVLNMQYARTEHFSPDGDKLIYGVYTPRGPNEKPGPSHLNFYIHGFKNGEKQQLLHDTIRAGSPRFSPDGKTIAFLYKKGKEKMQIWTIPVNGGEMKPLTHAESDIKNFKWHPQGEGIVYMAGTPKTEKEEELEERGYGFIYYEENLKNTNLYHVHFDRNFNEESTEQLTQDKNVWDFVFDNEGDRVAYTASEKNLIDQKYMFRKIYVMDIVSGNSEVVVEGRGKLGNYAFSPDGEKLAYTSAYNIHDHAVSQALVLTLDDKQVTNLTPEGYIGHMSWVEWKDEDNVIILAEEKVYPKLIQVTLSDGERTTVLDSENTGIIFGPPIFTDGFEKIAYVGSGPYQPYQVFVSENSAEPEQITKINERFEGKKYGEQEVFQYAARDGEIIEGILMKPVGYDPEKEYPLIMYVHGGPESHYSNGWLSRYSTPGQVMAGKGYLVTYVNYRASTGYGVDFGMEGFGDPAGTEFDDVADGIQHMISEYGANKDRVGVAGGSYGGYASAWFATYYTDYVKAVCMFVGVSNLLSKKGTTDIPYEDFLVHSGKPLEEQWLLNLQRSPVYWAHQSNTATLIYGGADDPRVHAT